jgi:glycosyltransferase involved in cell wall biosynthesis
LKELKTAIVHDWLAEYAGSERCTESFTKLWPDSDIFSLVDILDDEQRNIILKGKHPKTSFIQNLPFAKRNHRIYLPLFPYAIEQFDLSDYNMVISSSHAIAKGVLTRYDQLHICYCHTPIRYAWDLYFRYLEDAGLKTGLKAWYIKRTLHRMRLWDVIASRRPDYLIANSNHIAKRIKKVYGREAEVIYPPVDVDKFAIDSNKEDYYLTASRFVHYKRIDLIVESFNSMPDKKLLVVGGGPEEKKIKSIAKKNIEILPFQDQNSLKKLMQKAKAFVFAADEDFGIVVVEAMACGTPVIAWNGGGTKESVINGETGILYKEQNVNSIIDAINEFEKSGNKFSPELIRKHSEKFSRKNFEDKIRDYVADKTAKHFNNN